MVSHSSYHSIHMFYYCYFKATEFFRGLAQSLNSSYVVLSIYSVPEAYNLIQYVFSFSLFLLHVLVRRKSRTRIIFTLLREVKSDVHADQEWAPCLPYFMCPVVFDYKYSYFFLTLYLFYGCKDAPKY